MPFVKKKTVKIIPEKRIVEEREVDTLADFLADIELTEEQLRAAAQSYKEEVIKPRRFDQAEVMDRISNAEAEALKLHNATPSSLFVQDAYVADALVNKFGWRCLEKTANPKGYQVIRNA